MYFLSGRFDAVEDLFLIPNLPSPARRVYSRSAQLVNALKNNSHYQQRKLKNLLRSILKKIIEIDTINYEKLLKIYKINYEEDC